MVANGPSIQLNDFSGGLNTFDPENVLPLNQSPDEDNIVLLDSGYTKRNGDSVWNSSAMVSSSTPIVGLGYFKNNVGSEWLDAIAGTKFFADSGLSGSMSDKTGAITITSGQNNFWTPVIYNNLQIWFGGAPDAPFKYSGTGNIVALGGTPPSAATAFVANNRIFAIATSANPSRIQWPVLGDPEDWTGSGSGSSDVNKSDGEALQYGVVVGPDTAILFKNTSTHLMVLTRQPFPVYQLQQGIGVAGRNAIIQANGTVYFVTPGRRMKSTTDGINFTTYSDDADNLWDTVTASRIPYIQGVYHQQLQWIIWSVSVNGSTMNSYLIIWDLQHKCWLRCTTGFKSNVFAIVQGRRLFAGHYDGKLYEKLKSTIFADASETSPGAIDGHWRIPYKGTTLAADATIHPLYLDVIALSETSSNLTISYGFDFTSPSQSNSFSLIPSGSLWDSAIWDSSVWGGQNSIVLRQFVVGRGNFFSFSVGNNTASQGFTVQGASVRLRKDGARKVFANT